MMLDNTQSPSFSVHQDAYSPTPVLQGTDILYNTCQELLSREFVPGERSPTFARLVLMKLLYEPSFDLCSVLPPIQQANTDTSPPDHPFNLICQLLSPKSPFFETILDANLQLASDVWKAVAVHIERSRATLEDAVESALMQTISAWVQRLLPTEQVTVTPLPTTGQIQRVRTPLDLIRADSPYLQRIKFDVPEVMTSAHPKHLQMFCEFVVSLCDTTVFPCTININLLRFLLKQFHYFCLFDSGDGELAARKAALHARPPFASELYEFLAITLEQAVSFKVFRDLVQVWATFCRPWRYLEGNSDVPPPSAPQYKLFLKNQERFYRILLGKILRRILSFEVTSESGKTLKIVTEGVWRDPMCTILRELSIDARTAVRRVLDYAADARKTHANRVQYHTAKQKSLWDSICSLSSPEPLSIQQSRAVIASLDPLLQEADENMHTQYLTAIREQDASRPGSSGQNAADPLLRETPKRTPLLPDHERDWMTGLMYLTPIGRAQVLSGERKFDFSVCHTSTPSWRSRASRTYEFLPLARLLTAMTKWLNQSSLVRRLGNHYNDDTGVGRLARVLMDPPVPNPRGVASPVCSRQLKTCPPALRIRVLSQYWVLVLILVMLLVYKLHWWAVIPLLLMSFVGAIVFLGIEEF